MSRNPSKTSTLLLGSGLQELALIINHVETCVYRIYPYFCLYMLSVQSVFYLYNLCSENIRFNSLQPRLDSHDSYWPPTLFVMIEKIISEIPNSDNYLTFPR